MWLHGCHNQKNVNYNEKKKEEKKNEYVAIFYYFRRACPKICIEQSSILWLDNDMSIRDQNVPSQI